MTECFYANGCRQTYGYKRNPKGKTYTARFELIEKYDRFEIWSLGVLGRYRNKGYGTQMLMEFLSQFRFEKPLFLYVYKTNEIAIHLYEKVGFAIVGDCHFTSDAYTMQYVKTERK